MAIKNRIYKGDYIHGNFQPVIDPNGEVWSKNPGDLEAPPLTFPFSYEQIHDAVTAAKRSYLTWHRQSPQTRLNSLQRYREGLNARKEELAYWTSFEIGKPLWEAKEEVESTICLIDDFIKLGSQTTLETKVTSENENGFIRFVSRGVIVVLTPASLPILTSHSRFIPALIHGNTVVFKACKQAPMVGQLIAEIAHETAMPPGSLNVVHGDSEAARRLVSHPDVDAVFYAGNAETAGKIQKQLLTDYWKHLVIESGGKNAQLVWEDADYSKALYEGLTSSFLTSGQRCTSTSRILVHEKLFDRYLKDFHALSKKLTVGYGLLETNAPFMGPLVTENAVEDYLRFQGIAVREGCEEIMRGKTLERDKKGFYVSPSIHLVEKAEAKSIYQKSEIHGPNVALFKVKDIDEAIEIINQPQWGLVASVYTGARETFHRVAEEIRVGMLHWNRPTTAITHRLAVGGIKKSGNERMMGSYAGMQCTHVLSCVEDTKGFALEAFPKAMPRLEG